MKRALVLSGGGAYAAFEAGVVSELASQGERWDHFYGTSAGALNAAFLAAFPKRLQGTRVWRLVDFWRHATREKFMSSNLTGLAEALLGLPFSPRPSLFDTEPMVRTIAQYGSDIGEDVDLTVTVTDLEANKLLAVQRANGEKTGKYDFQKYILASAAVPVLFPPVLIHGRYYVDGGVKDNDPVALAVADGATEIDVVVCSLVSGERPARERKPTLATIIEDSVLDLRSTISAGDLDAWLGTDRNGTAIRHPYVRVRVFAPTRLPEGMTLLTFDREKIEALILHGSDVVQGVLREVKA